MTTGINLPQNIHPKNLTHRMVQGAALAFVLITLFITFLSLATEYPFHFIILLPILTVPLAGAFGGALYYFLDGLRYHGGWKKFAINCLNGIAYIAMLYMALIITFAATGLWD